MSFLTGWDRKKTHRYVKKRWCEKSNKMKWDNLAVQLCQNARHSQKGYFGYQRKSTKHFSVYTDDKLHLEKRNLWKKKSSCASVRIHINVDHPVFCSMLTDVLINKRNCYNSNENNSENRWNGAKKNDASQFFVGEKWRLLWTTDRSWQNVA